MISVLSKKESVDKANDPLLLKGKGRPSHSTRVVSRCFELDNPWYLIGIQEDCSPNGTKNLARMERG
jgi:hypothetical protein